MTLKKSTVMSGAAPYLGGKRRLANQIVSIISRIPHELYVEPFMGMGGIFFRRPLVPAHEVVNDISGEIINFFRILQKHGVELHRTLRFSFSSRQLFNDLIDTSAGTLTDVERAARFYYLQRNCFGGKVSGRNFGVDRERSRFNIRQLKKHVLALHKRLAGVAIECLPYHEVLRRYDSPGTLFYLDPPYWGCENDYGKNIFSPDDFNRLAHQLHTIKGKFLLSLNDVPEIRGIFSGFHMQAVNTIYSIGPNNKHVGELIISNTAI